MAFFPNFDNLCIKKQLDLYIMQCLYSHLLYGCTVWSLLKICLMPLQFYRRIVSQQWIFHYYPSYKWFVLNNNILKFIDIIHIKQIKIAYELIYKGLLVDLLNPFKLSSDFISHLTCNVANKGLHIPQIYTTSFGEKSLKYSAAATWNRFIKQHDDIYDIKLIGVLEHYLKNIFLSAYKYN